MNEAVQDHKQRRTTIGRVMTRAALVSLITLILLSIIAGVIGLGESLARTNGVLGALYYTAIVLLMCAGVIYPVVCVALKPVDSLSKLRTAKGTTSKRQCRNLVTSMVESGVLSKDQCEEANEILRTYEDPSDRLTEFFKEHFLPKIHATIKAGAKSAFFASAIVRSPLIEAVTMLSISLNLVRAIVEDCGFRPSNIALFKLYARVMLSALVASGLEEMDLDSMFAGIMGGSGASHVTGAVMASATQGMVSAFLVYRVGIMTRDILCSETPVKSMDPLRTRSYGEALALMRESGFIAEVLETVRAKAAQATAAAATKVKTAASQAGRSAYEAVTEAASAVGSAVSSVGSAMGNAVRSGGRIGAMMRDEGKER